jgi:hypothetical protein
LKALSRFVDVGVVSGGFNVNVMDGVVMVVDRGRAAGEEEAAGARVAGDDAITDSTIRMRASRIFIGVLYLKL